MAIGMITEIVRIDSEKLTPHWQFGLAMSQKSATRVTHEMATATRLPID